MSLRNLQRRMAKLEKGAKPKPSPVIILYGSWDAFVDGAYAAVSAGTLDAEFLDLVDTLRVWHRGMVGRWHMLADDRPARNFAASAAASVADIALLYHTPSMLDRLSARGLLGLIAALAILLFATAYLWVVGSAIAIDETGEVQTAFVITSDGRQQPLSQLWSGYFYAIPQLEGTLQVRCKNGSMNEAGYVTPHMHTKIRVVGNTPCRQLLDVL